MLDAIAALGRLQYSDEPEELIRGLVRQRRGAKKGETSYYLQLHFSTREDKCKLEVVEYSQHTPEQLNYVGIVPASGLQFHTTGHGLRHLCSQVLPALLDKLPEKSELAQKISHVLNNYFYFDKAAEKKSRYKYLIGLEHLGIAEAGWYTAVRESKKDKERPVVAEKMIFEYLKNARHISPDSIVLFAIFFDGEPVSTHPEYIQVVLDEQVSMFKKAKEGICYLTGNRELVSADLTKFEFKYYITDKLNFSSQFSGKYSRNFQLGKEAVWWLVLGERYIQNHLRMRIGAFNVYLIPEYFHHEAYEFSQIEAFVLDTADNVRRVSGMMDTTKLELNLTIDLADLEEEEGVSSQAMLNFIFYKKNKQEFKVFRHVKDVPPSRIQEMLFAIEKVNEYFRQLAPNFYFFRPSLESIYFLIPLEVEGGGEVKNPQQLMQFYDSVFCGRKMDRKYLIKQFMSLLARVFHDSTGGLQVGKRWRVSNDWGKELLWARLAFEQFQLLKWLEEINNLEREGGKPVSLILSEKLNAEERHLNSSGFDEAKSALFLLGCAIKIVGDVQRRELNSKPILRKLNFRGMNQESLQRLVLDVFEKGNQYKGKMYNASFFDAYFSEMKRLLDLALVNWQLEETETVFYILSGYSFLTAKSMKGQQLAHEEIGSDEIEEGEDEDE